MSNIKLAWQTSASVAVETDLISEVVQLRGSISDPLYNALLPSGDRIMGQELFLKNNGSLSSLSTALELGFYIRPWGTEYSTHGLEEAMGWASRYDPDGRPYGVFAVFGYDAAGTTSFVDAFLDNTITIADLEKFKISWSQGSSLSNRILLSTARRYISGGYTTSDNFESYDSTKPVLPNGETNGILRVLMGVRIPDDANTTRIKVNLTTGFEEPTT